MLRISLIIATLMLIPANAGASEPHTCKLKNNKIEVIGIGSSHNAAFENAATKCFERYQALEQAQVEFSGETKSHEHIDICVNIQCS